MTESYKILEHTADIGFEAFGKSRDEVIATAVTALVSIITDPDKIDTKKNYKIEVTGDDWEQLLVRFLNEVLYIIDGESFLPAKAEVQTGAHHIIQATLYGEKRNESHDVRTDVKAITYHQLVFKKTEAGYSIRVFVDI